MVFEQDFDLKLLMYSHIFYLTKTGFRRVLCYKYSCMVINLRPYIFAAIID
jgi:hypothetical protein